MSFADSKLTGRIADQQRAHIALAEKMIRKYWGNSFFISLDGENEILKFAKKRAHQIDKLEALSKFIGDDFFKNGIENSNYESLFTLHKDRISIMDKTDALSIDSRTKALLSMTDKVSELVSCYPKSSMDRYLLIVHNEGAEKAEEVRNGATGIKDYKTEYLRVYQPDPRESEISRPSFSQIINGGAGKAA
jgi:hypothetical protein